MKTVSITLPQGWETEEWKLKRFYADSYTSDVNQSGSIMASLTMKAADPILSMDGPYGFPETGLRLGLVIPASYMQNASPSRAEEIHVASCVSEDTNRLVPSAFPSLLYAEFSRVLALQSTLHVFNTLKQLCRELPHLWVSAVLASRRKPSDVGELPGIHIGGLSVSSDLDYECVSMTSSIFCCKCERTTSSQLLRFVNGSVSAVMECSTCMRSLAVSGNGQILHGTDCTINRIESFTCWVFCPCGKDCVFLENKRPRTSVDVSFLCGCPPTPFSYRFASAVTGHFDDKKQASPQVKPSGSPLRKYKEGVPLPSTGACKHYKKSFRWLLFDCCNEWFPCNQCHDARAKTHERQSGTHMLCGFCSREQVISPTCVSCGKETTPGWSASERVVGEPTRPRTPYWKKQSSKKKKS